MFPKNKKIGIDIDETIAASFSGLFEYCKTKKGVNAEWEDFTEFDLCKIPAFHLTKEEESELWKEFLETHHASIQQIDGSYTGLAILRKNGFTFHAITGRFESSDKEYTESWITKHFPGFFESIHYINHGTPSAIPKSEICKNLGISIMVDDSFDFALDLAHNDIKAIVLEKPWNKHRIETHANITRVQHWDEIPDLIQFLTYEKN